jgi:class 3 adenylate cyclase
MALKDDIETKVSDILRQQWNTRDGRFVPDDDSVGLSNEAVEIDATVLYADLDGSTSLVDSYPKWFSAEIYKMYLACASRIITSQDGTITAYDGDRVMAIFIGEYKNSNAVKAALKINAAVSDYINPGIKARYNNQYVYTVKQTVGIDSSKLFVAKTGVRGANDLVWVGRAANYAAKLCSLSDFKTYITHSVYNKISDEAKYSNGVDMWNPLLWVPMNNFSIYGSHYRWPL